MRSLTFTAIFVIGAVACQAAQQSKPVLYIEKDGFPGGHSTPEGAACDLARAYIKHDGQLFLSTCLKPFGGGPNRDDYVASVEKVADGLNSFGKKKTTLKGGLKSIGVAFAVRHLTSNGPVSYAYATFGFKDVAFVDVSIQTTGTLKMLNRTLVIQDSTGKWYVDPVPSISPLLSQGLNTEPASTKDILSVYNLKSD